MISRDPNMTPTLKPELLELAKQLGMKVVCVNCVAPDLKPGAGGGISFLAVVEHLPRVGEIIQTQDKKWCRVKDVVHNVTPMGDPPAGFMLVVTVMAVMIDPE